MLLATAWSLKTGKRQTYRAAISAHDRGISVRAIALVRRGPRSLDLIRVEDLELLS